MQHDPAPPIIRGMANTLFDSGTDVIDTTAVITRLILAGWPARDIEAYSTAAVLMALTRKINEDRK